MMGDSSLDTNLGVTEQNLKVRIVKSLRVRHRARGVGATVSTAPWRWCSYSMVRRFAQCYTALVKASGAKGGVTLHIHILVSVLTTQEAHGLAVGPLVGAPLHLTANGVPVRDADRALGSQGVADMHQVAEGDGLHGHLPTLEG